MLIIPRRLSLDLTALSVGEAEIYAVVKGGQVGLSLRSMYQDLGISMKIEIQSDSRRRILWRMDWEQDSERSTLTRGTSGYKNEFKMETSESRKCLRRKLRKCWNEASLCFSTTTVNLDVRIMVSSTMWQTRWWRCNTLLYLRTVFTTPVYLVQWSGLGDSYSLGKRDGICGMDWDYTSLVSTPNVLWTLEVCQSQITLLPRYGMIAWLSSCDSDMSCVGTE